ncbi:hypothetical protein C8R48DRAFT_690558 [Suillus tomentosus]|nr:hypothetical protein C8R48DRAFT_690558 [Suillus tomentosus]
MSDLDEFMELHRDAVLLRPPGHPDRSSSLNDLAISLRDRFHQQSVQSDLHEAFSFYSQLSRLSHAASGIDLRVAKLFLPCHRCFFMQCSSSCADNCGGAGGARSCSVLDPVGTLQHATG